MKIVLGVRSYHIIVQQQPDDPGGKEGNNTSILCNGNFPVFGTYIWLVRLGIRFASTYSLQSSLSSCIYGPIRQPRNGGAALWHSAKSDNALTSGQVQA